MTNTVLVTGGSSGIGAATSSLLASRGWRVFATSRERPSSTSAGNPAISWLRIDLEQRDSITKAAVELLTQAGRVDAIVNSAAYSEVGPLSLAQPEAVARQFQTNAFGPLLLTQLLLPAMRAQGAGRIVSVGTAMALMPLPLLGLYSSSKAASEALGDALRMECRGFGIRTITVIPGTVRTNFDHAALARARAQCERDRTPYEQPLARLEEMLDRSTSRGMPPSIVARRIAHALETPRPRSRYLVGLEGRLLYHGLRRMPRGMRDRLLRRPLGL